jgi:hypothetical protein
MSHKRSHPRVNSAGACLAVTLTLMLTWRLAPSVHAQTASGQSDPQTMLVVLKNQPARQVVDSLESRPGTPRKLAEEDLGRLRAHAGVPEQMQLDAGQRLVTELLAERREASAQIKAAIGPEQEMLAGRLTGFGATAIRRYTALNMLQARIPDAMLDVVKQDPAVAEVIPVGGHQDLLDQIEQGLSDPQELSVTFLDKADSSDPAEQAFAKLIDRIVYDRNALVAAASDAAAFNTVPAVYSLRRQARSGALPVAHQGIKALVLNGGKSGVFGNSVSAAKSFRLYTGRSEGPLHSTLAWDRRFGEGLDPYLRNLDLFLYDKGEGAQVASSESRDKNVEQVDLSDPGELVVKVKLQPSDDGGTAEESYALAVSGPPAFTPAKGPKLSVKCAADCVVGNDGDLPAYNVTASVQGQDYNLGTIQPSAHATFSPTSKASTPVATVVSQSFGETFTASSGSWTVSPSHLDAAGGQIIVTVTPPSGIGVWYARNSNDSFISVVPMGEVAGTGTITLIVPPNPNSSPRVGTVDFVDIFQQGTYTSVPFTQDGASTPPSITNLVPKGGESYLKGSSQVISWTYTPGTPAASSTTANIDLLYNGAPVSTLASAISLSSQTLSWTVPSSVTAGTTYQIRITPSDPGTYPAVSGSFAITDPPCTFTAKASATNPNLQFTYAGGTGGIDITATPSTCNYTVTNDSPAWLTLGSAKGTGSGTVGFTVAANTQVNGSTSARNPAATLTVNGTDSAGTTIFT